MSKRAPSKILIVGGSGFVSGTVARQALARGHQVWTITRGERAVPERVTALVADRHDHGAFEQAIDGAGARWDAVIDCIAFTPEDILQDLKLFEARAGRLVFVSTDFVYDPQQRRFPQSEEAEAYVDNGYGQQKRLAELELLQYTGALRWSIARPCHIYGPGSQLGCLPMHGRDPALIQRMQAGETLKLVGGGHFLQQPIFAPDLADFLLDLAGIDGADSQIFNVAGPDIIESRTFYQIIADILGVKLSIEEIPVKPYLAQNPTAASFLCHRIYDMRRATEVGIALPATSIAKGLRQHVESLDNA